MSLKGNQKENKLKNIRCFFCSHEWEAFLPLSKREECPACKKDARNCLNCVNYDEKAPHSCKETEIEPQKDKESANICDYFYPSIRKKDTQPSKDSLSALESLFQKK